MFISNIISKDYNYFYPIVCFIEYICLYPNCYNIEKILNNFYNNIDIILKSVVSNNKITDEEANLKTITIIYKICFLFLILKSIEFLVANNFIAISKLLRIFSYKYFTDIITSFFLNEDIFNNSKYNNVISYILIFIQIIAENIHFIFYIDDETSKENKSTIKSIDNLNLFIEDLFILFNKLFNSNIKNDIKSKYYIVQLINNLFDFEASNISIMLNSLNKSIIDKKLIIDEENKDMLSQYIKVLNNCNFKISLSSKLFEIIKLISHNNEELRTLALSIFSKLIKTISELKVLSSYNDLEKNNKYLKGLFSNSYNNCLSLENNIELPFNLKHKLRVYQLNGIQWLIFIGSLSLSGALCDDMGLGKTIQTLCAVLYESIKKLESVYNNNKTNTIINAEEQPELAISPSLIICPNSLSYNWIKEHNNFFYQNTNNNKIDSFNIHKIDSLITINKIILKNRNIINKPTQNPLLFVISYEKIKESDIFYLNSNNINNFFYLVLDEAHLLKNNKSKIYNSIKMISAERKIILSGTPIQNNIMELWSLFNLMMPGFLGEKSQFESNYNKKVHSTLKKLNLSEKLQDSMFQASINEIKNWVKPFILRRLKKDVLKDLPEKLIDDFVCEMDTIQDCIYKYFNNYTGIFNDKIQETVSDGNNNIKIKSETSNTNNNLENKKMHYIKNVNLLMNAINNPNNISSIYFNDLLNYMYINKLNDIKEYINFCYINEFEISKEISNYFKNNETFSKFFKNILENDSGLNLCIRKINCKIKALDQIMINLGFKPIREVNISNIDNKSNDKNNINIENIINYNKSLTENKIIIFSNYNNNLALIKKYLNKEYFNCYKTFKSKYTAIEIFSSNLNDKERFELVNNYNSSNSNIKVLLLNTSIGGLGLTLTSANIVIMYDHSWNPMKDLQAIDRAHRIGQKKTVQVYRLIVANSIEEKLISLQNFKKFVANAIVEYNETSDTNININNLMQSFETKNISKCTSDNKNKVLEDKKNKGKLSLKKFNEQDILDFNSNQSIIDKDNSEDLIILSNLIDN